MDDPANEFNYIKLSQIASTSSAHKPGMKGSGVVLQHRFSVDKARTDLENAYCLQLTKRYFQLLKSEKGNDPVLGMDADSDFRVDKQKLD